MKTVMLLLVAVTAFAADWEDVRHIAVDTKVEVTAQKTGQTRGTFVSASAEELVVRENSGQRSVARSDIREVRVLDSGRRLRKGLMWMAIGAGAGVGAGFAACPSCSNEGSGGKYVGPGVAAGAALGALGFLSSPYRTVYKHQ